MGVLFLRPGETQFAPHVAQPIAVCVLHRGPEVTDCRPLSGERGRFTREQRTQQPVVHSRPQSGRPVFRIVIAQEFCQPGGGVGTQQPGQHRMENAASLGGRRLAVPHGRKAPHAEEFPADLRDGEGDCHRGLERGTH